MHTFPPFLHTRFFLKNTWGQKKTHLNMSTPTSLMETSTQRNLTTPWLKSYCLLLLLLLLLLLPVWTHTHKHTPPQGRRFPWGSGGFEKMKGRRSYCPVQRPCCNLVFGLGVAASAESHWGCWESKWRQSKHDHGNVGLSHSCHKMWHYLDDVLWKHATKF